jgi:hypothetical protein
MNEIGELKYQLYKCTKILIERSEAWCQKHNDYELMNNHWKKAVEIFDSLDLGYAERYEKEKENESNSGS